MYAWCGTDIPRFVVQASFWWMLVSPSDSKHLRGQPQDSQPRPLGTIQICADVLQAYLGMTIECMFFLGFAHPTNQQTIHPSMHPCMCLFICCISLYSLSVFPSLLHVFLLSFCLPVCLSTYFHLLHWQAGVRSTFPCGPGPDKPCAWQVQLQDVFLWHRWVFKACPISGLTKRRGPSGLAPRPNRLQMAQPDKTQLHITKTSAQTAPRDWHCGKLMWLSLGLQH